MIGDRELTEEKDIMGQIISAEGNITKIPVFLDQRNWKRFLPSDKFSVPDTPLGENYICMINYLAEWKSYGLNCLFVKAEDF